MVALLVLAVLVWLRVGLYHRFILFPREERAWQEIRAQRQAVAPDTNWIQYRGILHSHSHFSHDSEVSFEHILDALQVAHLDFICMSDHPIHSLADFSWQWRGLHQGKLFIPGFEMRDGIMPFGVASSVVLSDQMDTDLLCRQVVTNGGVLFYAHPEEPRRWDQPELTGMEIFNIHTELKSRRGGLAGLMPDFLLNLKPYPEHLYARLLRRPGEILEHWDAMNRTRHLTGISGTDAHQNVGFRGFCTTNGTLKIEDTSPRTLKEFRLNWATRPLARLFFGPLTPGRLLFHVQLDPYERSARLVNTHLLAHELSEEAILDALRAGRGYVAFDMVADSSGFRWEAEGPAGRAVMGETLAFNPEVRLHARSPLPCRFSVFKDGALAGRAEGRALDWTPPGPGKYRVEAELKSVTGTLPWAVKIIRPRKAPIWALRTS